MISIVFRKHFSTGLIDGLTTNPTLLRKSGRKHDDVYQEFIDKKKLWTLLEKNFGAICIKLPEASINGETYLFVCGPNKKCPEVTNTDSFVFFSPNEITKPRKQTFKS